MTFTVIAVRHVDFEDLGTLRSSLTSRGATIHYLDAGSDDLAALDPLAADLCVLLGGPIGAADVETYPFLGDETRIAEARLAADRPTLGVCLGAQVMAQALGARIYAAPAREIGWAPIHLTDDGRASSLEPLGQDGGVVLHWHGDTFDLPAGATLLASSDVCPNQAFAYKSSALALQFHAEADPVFMERWFIGHACEIASTPGIDVPRLRDDTKRYGASLVRRSQAVFETWLSNVGFTPTER